jgi:hypothetical protein
MYVPYQIYNNIHCIVRPTSCKMRQLACSMGLECMEICIRASKAAPQVMIFELKDRLTHIYFNYCIYYILINIFHHRRLKIKHFRELLTVLSFLGLLPWLRKIISVLSFYCSSGTKYHVRRLLNRVRHSPTHSLSMYILSLKK